MAEISVIIPCYNLARYLEQSVGSVLEQTFADWECLIVNDGSTDHTSEIAAALVKKDRRIRYFEQANQGLSAARNRGLNAIKGSYVQFLDADDWIAPEKFDRQLADLKQSENPGLSYCDYDRHFEDPRLAGANGRRISPELDRENPLRALALNWESGLSIPSHCFLFDARFFSERNIRFDEALPNHEDWECWMQIFATGPWIFYVPDVLATYRFRADSITADLGRMRKGFRAAIRKQQGLLRDNREMCAVLSEKRRNIDEQYRDYRFPRSAYLGARQKMAAVARRRMPDGMRRVLRKIAVAGK